MNVDCIATGHNADDIAETILMNILRGDISRLQRCTSIITVSLKLVSFIFNILINYLFIFFISVDSQDKIQ